MKIQERREGDLTALDLEGDLLSGEGGARLRAQINSLLEEGRVKITLNLAGLQRTDSDGLGELVECYQAVSNKKGKLKVLHLSKTLHPFWGGDDDDWPNSAAGVSSLGAMLNIKP